MIDDRKKYIRKNIHNFALYSPTTEDEKQLAEWIQPQSTVIEDL